MATKTGKDDTIRLTLRLSPSLHKQLQDRSLKNKRSINQEIITLLERFVDSTEICTPNDQYLNMVAEKSKQYNTNKESQDEAL